MASDATMIIRLPAALREAVVTYAAERRMTTAEAVRAALERYVKPEQHRPDAHCARAGGASDLQNFNRDGEFARVVHVDVPRAAETA